MPVGSISELLPQVMEYLRGPPAVPDITDEVVLMKQYQRKRQLAALQGRSATFLTGPRGLGGPPSEIASAFLRAALEPPAPWPIAPTPHPTQPAPPPLEDYGVDTTVNQSGG